MTARIAAAVAAAKAALAPADHGPVITPATTAKPLAGWPEQIG